MLTALTETGYIEWKCFVLDDDGELTSCGETMHTYIDNVKYMPSTHSRGAVLALPQCECGAQTFLKADYTLKELWKVTLSVKNNAGVIWAYVLPLRYTRSLLLHHMLYTLGMCDTQPILSHHPDGQCIQDNRDLTAALWFGIMTVRAFTAQIEETKQ